MPDLLVNLQNLPAQTSLAEQNIIVRPAQPWELSAVRRFIIEHFSTAWADEVQVGFANKPITVLIAISEQELVGFSAYECTRRGFFGPTGVLESARGKGIGTALLIAALRGLQEMGYAYGIIGGVGPVSFYEKAVGAIMIPGSDPGIYRDRLK
jgi:GNAT superfamily N-acetyltransferase